jgi:hypothetical protein
MSFTVTFDSEQEVQRLIYLAHRDLCRIEGALVIAERRLEDRDNLAGRMRRNAVQTVESAPAQIQTINAALEALRGSLAANRNEGSSA